MSDQTKNFIAYIVSLSLLIFGFSLFKTWAPPVPVVRGVVTETPQRAAVLPGSSLE
jgi:hypothetical protein